jgi:hypothetical protein
MVPLLSDLTDAHGRIERLNAALMKFLQGVRLVA